MHGCCRQLPVLLSAPRHRQGSNRWSRRLFPLATSGSWVLPAGAGMLRGDAGPAAGKWLPAFKTPNSLSSSGGLGKQKDFSAAREAFEGGGRRWWVDHVNPWRFSVLEAQTPVRGCSPRTPPRLGRTGVSHAGSSLYQILPGRGWPGQGSAALYFYFFFFGACIKIEEGRDQLRLSEAALSWRCPGLACERPSLLRFVLSRGFVFLLPPAPDRGGGRGSGLTFGGDTSGALVVFLATDQEASW